MDPICYRGRGALLVCLKLRLTCSETSADRKPSREHCKLQQLYVSIQTSSHGVNHIPWERFRTWHTVNHSHPPSSERFKFGGLTPAVSHDSQKTLQTLSREKTGKENKKQPNKPKIVFNTFHSEIRIYRICFKLKENPSQLQMSLTVP